MQYKWLDEIKQKKVWKNISKYNFKENNEWTVYDYEQSALCQIIWGEILTNFFNISFESSMDEYTYLINRNALVITNKNKNYRFLFDIMNNLKEKWSPDKKKHEYHFIGNFTPIPANNNCNKRSLQFIHRDFNENWNKMLIYLKDNWECFQMNELTFEKYIEFTYQDAYYYDYEFKEITSIEEIKAVISDRGRKIQDKCSELFGL